MLCKLVQRWGELIRLVQGSPSLRLAVGCLLSRSCWPVAARGDALLGCRLGGGVGKILVYALKTCGADRSGYLSEICAADRHR